MLEPGLYVVELLSLRGVKAASDDLASVLEILLCLGFGGGEEEVEKTLGERAPPRMDTTDGASAAGANSSFAVKV